MRRVREETQKSLAEDPTDSLLIMIERATRNEGIYAALEEEDDGKTRAKPFCKKINDSIEQDDSNSIAKVNIEKQPDLKIELVRQKAIPMITGVCRIEGLPVEYELDTGATVSLIDEKLYMRLNPRSELKPSKVKIVAATDVAFEMLGEIHVSVEFGNHIIETIIYVVKEKLSLPLIGRDVLNACPPLNKALASLRKLVSDLSFIDQNPRGARPRGRGPGTGTRRDVPRLFGKSRTIRKNRS